MLERSVQNKLEKLLSPFVFMYFYLHLFVSNIQKMLQFVTICHHFSSLVTNHYVFDTICHHLSLYSQQMTNPVHPYHHLRIP